MIRHFRPFAAIAPTALVPASWPAQPADVPAVPLIARAVLFGNPDRSAVRISPDGAQVSFLAPKDGVMNVWVGPIGDPGAAKAVTADEVRGIRQYSWAYDSAHVLYRQDTGGDENWRIYSVDLASGKAADLTPLAGVAAQIVHLSPKFPTEVLIGLNDRDPQLHDVYRVDIRTGQRTLVQKNEGFVGFVPDDDFQVRLAVRYKPDASSQILKPASEGKWEPFLDVPVEDSLSTNAVGFDKAGGTLYLIDSRGRDTAALKAVDMATGQATLLAQSLRADIGDVLVHPTEKTVQAVSTNYTRAEWRVLDKAIAPDMDYLRTVAAGDIVISSRSLDDQHWSVAFLTDNGPVRYYHYDRRAHKATFLFSNRKALEGLTLARMHPVVIPSRDGLSLVSYLSLPPWTDTDNDARPSRPLPMVLLVHGGPWGRDDWGFDPLHQWLANRGYAVLSVNFRGSTGLGKAFTNAGDGEWAGKMHDDLLDAVKWAVDNKVADPRRVGIMGGSYGGYATLVGLTFTPEEFVCGVDIVGPSNLVTLLEHIPPYWAPFFPVLKTRVGDPGTPEGQKALLERSPLSRAASIKRPLLIGQGANDPRVKQAEADQIVEAMKKNDIPVTYVLFPDEGHGFARPENSTAFFAVSEAFLAEHMGGRYEPIGDDFKGSSITVPEGVQNVPGLGGAVKK